MAEETTTEGMPAQGDSPRTRIRVLLSVCGFPPASRYGGPAVSLDNLTRCLKSQVDCFVVTRSHDLGDRRRLLGISDGWNDRSGVRVRYLDDGEMGLDTIRNLVGQVRPDVVYANSLFDAMFLVPMLKAAREKGVPAVIAPRGELCAGAFENWKRWKKLPYLAALGPWLRSQGTFWHSTNDEETRLIQDRIGVRGGVWTPSEGKCALEGKEGTSLDSDVNPDAKGNRESGCGEAPRIFQITETPMLPDRKAVESEKGLRAKRQGELRCAFLSRIHPHKNLLLAIQALKGVRGRVTLDVMGPIEDPRYWAECQSAMASLPPGVRVEYLGEVPHGEVHLAFARRDLFLLPTRSENYGHAVAEALSADCPVAISRGTTPWDDVEKMGAGRTFALGDPEEITRVVQAFVDMDQRAYDAVVGSVRAYVDRMLDLSRTVAGYVDMFRRVGRR